MTDRREAGTGGTTERRPIKPRVMRVPNAGNFCSDDWCDDEKITLRRLTDINLGGKAGQGVSLERSICTRVSFEETRLHLQSARDVCFEGCNMANAIWVRSFWERVAVTDSRLTGFDLRDAEMRNVLISGCKADMACFRSAKCKSVRIEECCLTEADFQDADL